MEDLRNVGAEVDVFGIDLLVCECRDGVLAMLNMIKESFGGKLYTCVHRDIVMTDQELYKTSVLK